MNNNACEHEFVLKLCFCADAHTDQLSLIGSVTRNRSALPEHLSSDDLEMLLMNRASALSVERAEQHLLYCEQCQDQASAGEIEIAALRSALQ